MGYIISSDVFFFFLFNTVRRRRRRYDTPTAVGFDDVMWLMVENIEVSEILFFFYAKTEKNNILDTHNRSEYVREKGKVLMSE